MDIRESVKQALEDPVVKNAIKDQIDAITETKASQRVNELLNKNIQELNEDCEQFKLQLKEQNEKILEQKIEELKEEYNRKAELYEDRCAEKLTEALSKYTKEVIDNFLEEHKEAFTIRKNHIRANAILEGLSAVCAVAGVRAEQITEGVNYLNDKQTIINDQRIKNLKNQLRLSEENANNLKKTIRDKDDEIQDLKDDFDEAEQNYLDMQSESDNELKDGRRKIIALEKAVKEYAREARVNESRIDEAERLREENRSLIESLKQIKSENRALSKENEKVLKMGAISEMKQGMSLTEAKYFEQIASEIPFERSKQYFDKLEILKNELINNPRYKKLNEITGEEMDGSNLDDEFSEFENPENSDDSEETSVSRWDHLI